MRVFSPENEYTVLSRLRDGRRFTALDRDERPCLIVIEKKAQEAKRLTPILQKWLQIKEFSDFYEFFPYKGGVAAVFAHYADGKPLDRALADMSYTQRADALRSIFALTLRQNLPPEILRGVFYPENLRISPSGKTELLYDLPRSGESAVRYTIRSICGDCAAPEIYRLFVSVEDITAYNYVELYESAGLASDKLACYTPPPTPEKLSLNAVRKRAEALKAAVLRRVAVVLAITAILVGFIAVGVLFYRAVIAPPRVDNGISAIGTVVIDNGS